MAFEAARIAIEHMTPVILLTDAFIANGSSAWRVPEADDYPAIKPNFVTDDVREGWKPYKRNDEQVRYWAIPGQEGLQHRLGGLEKDFNTSALSNDPINHEKMVLTRLEKVNNVANHIADLEVLGDKDADTLLVGWGGTFGHLYTAVEEMQAAGKKVALAQFRHINPLPKNAEEVLRSYKNVIVAELNTGQFADYLQSRIAGLVVKRINKTQGQPFLVQEVIDGVTKIMEGK